ncbi:MAG TPA: ATP-binding protein [Planktothrix sp.]
MLIELSGILQRWELQTINRRFDARPWLRWSPESLQRLNPVLLWQWHQTHELPRQWWAWDYTLSWLIENNHPPISHKIVIFNHMQEDEPPAAAVHEFPWMKPLLKWPLSRATMADTIKFIAKGGAKLIILDYEFPEYTDNDPVLAEAMWSCASGKLTGKPVPVLLSHSISRRSFSNVVQLEVPPSPSGVLDELQKLEPGASPRKTFTGLTGVFQDEDQVVRQIECSFTGRAGDHHESIVVKALRALNEPVPDDLPDTMDINFFGPPNRQFLLPHPYTYLFDPRLRAALVNPPPDSQDVSLKDAVVILGDGVTDIFSTPTTNLGGNPMSGTEILATAFETVSNHRWLTRLYGEDGITYLVAVCLCAGLFTVAWKMRQEGRIKQVPGRSFNRLMMLASDLFCFFLTVVLNYLVACLFFAYNNLIVPVISPTIGLMLGALAAVLLEREEEREQLFRQRLQAAEEKLVLQEEVHNAEMDAQRAKVKTAEIEKDQELRHEFARRINHDLRAPVSVLSWTISRLKRDGLQSKGAPEKVERLANTADKLFGLINELVKSYDKASQQETAEMGEVDLVKVVTDSYKLQTPLAEERNSTLEYEVPVDSAFAKCDQLGLSRCIDNLIRNAFFHNDNGVKVKVLLKPGPAHHRIEVRDNGKGIAADNLGRIFESGFSTSEKKSSGSHEGLGLSIVKTQVEKMNATITVESQLNQGASFIISIANSRPSDSGLTTSSDRPDAISGDKHVVRESASNDKCNSADQPGTNLTRSMVQLKNEPVNLPPKEAVQTNP